MPLPNEDPSNPALPAPIFADVDAVRGDQLRANNQLIYENFDYLNDGGNLNDAAAKNPPVDADTLPLSDSAASGVLKKLTFANLWAWIKSKFDTLSAGSALGGTEKIPMVQSSSTVSTTPADLKTYIAPKYAKLSDTKSAGTSGGTFNSGAWRIRDINTKDNDTDNIVSLSSNQFTLQAGTYRIRAESRASQVEVHKIKLYNTTDNSDTIVGINAYARQPYNGESPSSLCGEFTIASAKTFEIQHRCTANFATEGFGVATNFGVSEVYTVVEIWKIG